MEVNLYNDYGGIQTQVLAVNRSIAVYHSSKLTS